MHLFWVLLFGLIALFWATYGLKVACGAARLPWLRDYEPAQDADCPSISLLFAARDEEEKLPVALATLIAIDYPQLEIIAVMPLRAFSINSPALIHFCTSCTSRNCRRAG